MIHKTVSSLMIFSLYPQSYSMHESIYTCYNLFKPLSEINAEICTHFVETVHALWITIWTNYCRTHIRGWDSPQFVFHLEPRHPYIHPVYFRSNIIILTVNVGPFFSIFIMSKETHSRSVSGR